MDSTLEYIQKMGAKGLRKNDGPKQMFIHWINGGLDFGFKQFEQSFWINSNDFSFSIYEIVIWRVEEQNRKLQFRQRFHSHSHTHTQSITPNLLLKLFHRN